MTLLAVSKVSAGRDPEVVAAIVRAVAPKPVNIVVGTKQGAVPIAELQAAGVRRISMGAALYLRAMADLKAAAQALKAGDTAAASRGMPSRQVAALIEAAA